MNMDKMLMLSAAAAVILGILGSPVLAQDTCGSLYGVPELNTSTTTTVYSLTNGTYEYFYFNAKRFTIFAVGLSEFSGSPLFHISKAADNLQPTAANAELHSPSSYDLVEVDPSTSECYVIGVEAGKTGASFRLQLKNGVDPVPSAPPAEATCSDLFGVPASRESFNATITPILSLTQGSVTYYYMNAKKGVFFTVYIPEFSGNPNLYVTRAVNTLTPSDQVYEDRSFSVSTSGGRISVNPTISECWAIGVQAETAATFRLRISDENSPTPTIPIETPPSCSDVFENITTTEELSNSSISPVQHLGDGQLQYFYFNAIKGESFTVSIEEFSGKPDLFASRAIANLEPNNLQNSEEFSFSFDSDPASVFFIPAMSECYAIGVKAASAISFRLQIQVTGTELPKAPPVETTCGSLYNEVKPDRELFNSTITPLYSVASGLIVYYFNAKKGESFTASIPEFSGFREPYLVISRAVSTLYPNFLYDGEVTGNPSKVTPTVTECYAIAVDVPEPTTFRLQIKDSKTLLPEIPASTSTCGSLYGVEAANEFSTNSILGNLTLSAGSEMNLYYNAKKGEAFSVSILTFTGNPGIYLSRAVATLQPNETSAESYSNSELFSDSVEVTPKVSECYAITVKARSSSSFELRISSPPETTQPPQETEDGDGNGDDGDQKGTGSTPRQKSSRRVILIVALSILIPTFLGLAIFAILQVRKEQQNKEMGIPLTKSPSHK